MGLDPRYGRTREKSLFLIQTTYVKLQCRSMQLVKKTLLFNIAVDEYKHELGKSAAKYMIHHANGLLALLYTHHYAENNIVVFLFLNLIKIRLRLF